MPATLFAAPDQILTVEQMRAAEAALIAAGTSVDALMQTAGRGAAEYVWRMAGLHRITVVTGPGNNGGDGWVIAEAIRERGGQVAVIPAMEPKTDAARKARALYRGEVLPADAEVHGELLVDCIFGSGLTRGLDAEVLALLTRLAASHRRVVAVDVPSGVDSDTGACLSEGLPENALTIALGAWKPAHFLMPAAARLGDLRLVPIGCGAVPRAGQVLRRPRGIVPPAADAHKYARGLLGIVAGAMPGAAILAARAALGAGAGYVQLMAARPMGAPAEIVVADDALMLDQRLNALLVGPGLGREEASERRLVTLLRDGVDRRLPMVLDADALALLRPAMLAPRAGMMQPKQGPCIVTPHEGELKTLEEAFGLKRVGGKLDRALALARAGGFVVVAKGPDTVIADPAGFWLIAPRASSWLSTAGTGDVLAGCIASRLAMGVPAFGAAAQGVWLHGAAARAAGVGFSAGDLAGKVALALAEAL